MKKLAPASLADIAKEIATDADKFTISFPQDLKVRNQPRTNTLFHLWQLAVRCYRLVGVLNSDFGVKAMHYFVVNLGLNAERLILCTRKRMNLRSKIFYRGLSSKAALFF